MKYQQSSSSLSNSSNDSSTKHNLRIIRLMGGLGNQMFQYAFGIASKCNMLDCSHYSKSSYRSFDLNLYNIEKNLADKKQIKKCLNEIRFKNPLPKSLRNKFNLCNYIYIKTNRAEENQINRFQPDLLEKNGDVCYIGYFQTEKYFKQYRDKILNDFQLLEKLDDKNNSMLEKITNCNSVAIHVRRGDYLNPKVPLVVLEKEYYMKAINYIAKHVVNPHFFVFSNDAEWVRENIKSTYPIEIVDINDENHGYFDLELMRNCKHDIIANSSFSWWGAWLNTNPNKIVVAPSKWFKPDAIEYSGDIVCDDWMKIE